MARVWLVLAVALAACAYDRPADVPGDAGRDGPSGPSSVLGEACDPLDNACRGDNPRCGWFVEQPSAVAHSGCAPSGPAEAGQACAFGAGGHSNCAVDTECFDGVCEPLCATGGELVCGSAQACRPVAGVFTGSTLAGCATRCNPLTQATADDAARAACGSPDPAAPVRGCYNVSTSGLYDFICMSVPAAAAELTDRMIAAKGPNEFPIDNGCAPGYLPFFGEGTGSMNLLCTGMCAPAKTDNTSIAEVSGDASVPVKLPAVGAPRAGDGVCVTGKKGSQAAARRQNCLFSWSFGAPGAPLGDVVGLCHAQDLYTYDHDMNMDTPRRPYPSCHELPRRDPLPANCTCSATAKCSGTGCPDGVADEWGCYPSTSSPPALRAPLRDVRLGHGPAVLRPHVLR